jgi:hypothetical protein
MKGLMSSLVSLLDVGAGRVLASLGMGFISFTAVTGIVNLLISQLQSTWSGIGGAAFQLISIAGFPTALGITIGAIITRLTINAIPKLGKLTS